ncbi:MAG: hypothetical protein AAF488_16600, partial [Planctomycetota bacterium]
MVRIDRADMSSLDGDSVQPVGYNAKFSEPSTSTICKNPVVDQIASGAGRLTDPVSRVDLTLSTTPSAV